MSKKSEVTTMRFDPKDRSEEEIFAIEDFRSDVQHAIHRVMMELKVSRKDLAKRLGCSEANLSQIMSETANPRLETIARIFHALGDKPSVHSKVLRAATAKAARESQARDAAAGSWMSLHVDSALVRAAQVREDPEQKRSGSARGSLVATRMFRHVRREQLVVRDISSVASNQNARPTKTSDFGAEAA